MKTLLLIPVILYTWLSLTHDIPSNTKPHQQTKIHILNPTRPTDNPIRDLNPKNTNLLTNIKINTKAQYEQ